ncbi:YLP motif-containing protein 1-like [Ischnura elegans]|uniref:YLP motif-containing protein 1-like n=1 Tax=Ischnura elegans TaxID=197161 RepID=UPI001ED87167|nr:YLP motif-containing protein 1-like [Ischnura elegans]
MAEHINKKKRKADGDQTHLNKRRATTKQLFYLAHYMAEHKDFSGGRLLTAQGKAVCDRHWGALTKVLNKLPGPQKDISEWKKCWTDLKCNVRGRAAKAKIGPMPTRVHTAFQDLPDLDIEVLEVIGLDSCYGLQQEEFGLGDRAQEASSSSQTLVTGGSESRTTSSPSIESRVPLLPSEIKTSDSPPASPYMSDTSFPHQITIPIPKLSPNSTPTSPQSPSDPFAISNPPTTETSADEAEEKPMLAPLSSIPPLTKIPMSSVIPPLPTLTPLTALPPLSALPPLTAITPKGVMPTRPGPSSDAPEKSSPIPANISTASSKSSLGIPQVINKRPNSLSTSLTEATEKLKKSQEKNTEALMAIHGAIDRLAAASEANNEIQLQFLAEHRKFTSILEIALTHWLKKDK